MWYVPSTVGAKPKKANDKANDLKKKIQSMLIYSLNYLSRYLWSNQTLISFNFYFIVSAQKPITICIIKPDVQKEKQAEIIQKIKDKDYQIIESKEIKLTQEEAHDFYKKQENTVRNIFGWTTFYAEKLITVFPD